VVYRNVVLPTAIVSSLLTQVSGQAEVTGCYDRQLRANVSKSGGTESATRVCVADLCHRVMPEGGKSAFALFNAMPGGWRSPSAPEPHK
jgi:hypothetical protein